MLVATNDASAEQAEQQNRNDRNTPVLGDDALRDAQLRRYFLSGGLGALMTLALIVISLSTLEIILPHTATLLCAALLCGVFLSQLIFAHRYRAGHAFDSPARLAWLQEIAHGLGWSIAGALTLYATSGESSGATVLIAAVCAAAAARAVVFEPVLAHIVLVVLPSACVLLVKGTTGLAGLLLAAAALCVLAAARYAQSNRRALVVEQRRDETGEPVSTFTAESAQTNTTVRTAFAALKDGVIVVDADGRIAHINRAAQALCGCSEPEAEGRALGDVVKLAEREGRPRMREQLERALVEGHALAITDGVALVAAGSRSPYTVELTLTPLDDAQNGPTSGGAILILRDLTEYKGLTSLMEFQATRDSLTGLLNRREFESRLRRALETAAPERPNHSLCYLDIDSLDRINDICGYAAGDQLLREVARCLQTLIREHDTLCRLGGDRFGVLFQTCDGALAATIAERMRSAITDIRFPWQEQTFDVSASFGVVDFRELGGHAGDLLSAAGSACHVAKERGGNRVELYQRGDAAMERQNELTRWMGRVQDAVANNAFQLLMQPIAPINGTPQLRPHGEFLVRMQDERGSLISPQTFMLAAERYQLMPSVDRWVIHNALQALRRADNTLHGMDTFAINLSGQSLSDPSLLEYVQTELAQSGVAAGRVCFEITETAVMENVEAAQRFIRSLKESGCQFALDDFGSGLSSYGYLKELPVDYLKIDGSFVRGIEDNTTDRAVVESINQIGHALGKYTIAEYAENERIIGILRDIGVDYAQGTAIGEPKTVC